MSKNILTINNVSKSFPKVIANKNISFNIKKNTVLTPPFLCNVNVLGKLIFVDSSFFKTKPFWLYTTNFSGSNLLLLGCTKKAVFSDKEIVLENSTENEFHLQILDK